MFSRAKAWPSYRQVATQTASPGQVVLMLYDGILRCLEQASTGFSKDDPEECDETINNNTQRAQTIINEMNQSLNLAEGGEFASRMRGLCDYFDRRLQESNMAKTGDELAALYEQWRTLTEEEGKAITAEAWTNVEHCQNAKSRLQPRIFEVSRRLDPDSHDRQFKPVLRELMEMERRNNALLRERCGTADRARETIDRSSRNLRQLHKSYIPPAKTLWQSYS